MKFRVRVERKYDAVSLVDVEAKSKKEAREIVSQMIDDEEVDYDYYANGVGRIIGTNVVPE